MNVGGGRGGRVERILALLRDGARSSARLCEVSTNVTGVSGSGVMLMSGDVPRGAVCSSNAVSAAIEDLQYMLGEGPCMDAYTNGRVVAVPDLSDPTMTAWPAFRPQAVQAGARAMFGFPVGVGAVRLGALNLYRDRTGPLSDEQHADALVMADVAAWWVLDLQADAPMDALAAALEIGADFHFAVQNAAGIVSVQLGISVTESLIRLRAYAFSRDRPLGDVAREVIEHRLRLE